MPNCIGAERVRLRLSQTDLGDKLGVSRSIIVRIERDPKSATYDQLEKMSQLFGCSIQYLLGETDDRLPQKDAARGIRASEAWSASLKQRAPITGWPLW